MSRKLADWLDAYMQYTENSEPPKMFHTWTAISTIASALQRKCVLNWGHLRFYPNMYIVLVGPPGKVRKGTAMGFGQHFLEKLNIKISADSITREALIRTMAEAQDSVINEATGAVKFHCSLTIYAPELVVFLGHNQQQLMMDLTDWFDCGKGEDGIWQYRTKHQGDDNILGVWANLLGATTPDLMRSSLSMDAIGGGLTSRMIFVFESEKYKTCPLPFLGAEAEKIGTDLEYDLEQIHMLKGQFKPSKDFIELWKDWYVASDANPVFTDGRLAPYCERRPVHVMKLSMILCASRTDNMIVTATDLSRAVTILENTERNMAQTFTGIGKSPHADILPKVMQTIGIRKEIKVSELQRMFYNDADARTLQAMIVTLRNMKFIRIRETGNDSILEYLPGRAGGMR